jgi:hypothetical protein
LTLEDVPLEPEERYAPHARRAARYQSAMATQHELYDALIGHDAEIGQRLAGSASFAGSPTMTSGSIVVLLESI